MISKTFIAKDENLDPVITFIHSVLPPECKAEILNKIDLAVEEIFINIAHYAYDGKEGNAEISCSFENNNLCVEFADTGVQCNPLQKEDPDITKPLEERDIGGLGIFLTKQFMDTVDYKYENNKNILTIQKRIE